MNYSQKTQDLIDRMCRCVERSDFVLEKEKAEALILKTYDLFSLVRPKNIKWCIDLEDKEFQSSASSAWSASSASSTRSARSASSASSAWWSSSARLASSASSAWSASSARLASSASSARSALDYDFDYFIFSFENKEANQSEINENDIKYLEYCELLMRAKEAGLGYLVEWEDTLYLVPTPIVKINKLNQFHSDKAPAILWKSGKEIFYLNGVMFNKELWKNVVAGNMPFKDILAIEDIDQRTQAMKYGDVREFLKHQNAKLLDTHSKIAINGEEVKYELYEIPKNQTFIKDVHYVLYNCPSTNKQYMKGVPPFQTVAEAMSWGMSGDNDSISPENWKLLVPLVDES